MTEMKAENEYKEISEMFKDLKDPKDIAKHIDFENPTVIRGKTPEGIEDQCLSLCQQYLAGNWLTQTKDTVKFTRIVGGWMNQLYYIKINEPKEDETVPQEVTIKFDGGVSLGGFDNKLLKDQIIAMVFSDKGLGPKVYGVFDKGVIQSYHKHRCFHKKEHDNQVLVDKVFRKLAHVHTLDAPISKDPNWQLRWAESALEKARNNYDLEKEMEEYKCDDLKRFSFEDEMKWLKEKLKEFQSPVVFTHNDYRSSNLLITEPNDDLIICDFDISCYGYRGADFVPLLRDYGPKLDPGSMKLVEDFPVKDDVMGPLIALYVDECTEIHGKAFTDDPNNSVEHILKEMKFFWFFNTIAQIAMCIGSDPNDTKGFPIPRKLGMEYGNFGIKNYHIMKQMLIDNNIITP